MYQIAMYRENVFLGYGITDYEGKIYDYVGVSEEYATRGETEGLAVEPYCSIDPMATSLLCKEYNGFAKLQGGVTRARVARIASVDEDWKARERARFESGEYEAVPWEEEEWWKGSEPEREHFLHLSRNTPGRVAGTFSDLHGAMDRQTMMNPGKYLRKYNHLLGLSEADIAKWAAICFMAGEDLSVEFATTGEDIERVYLYGPHSCMAHMRGDYLSDSHPVSVYGAGDLAVAYVRRGEGQSISARTVCWPEKKVFSTIYGDGGAYSEVLENYLISLGYTHGDAEDFHGARLEWEWNDATEDDEGNDVSGPTAPYFDREVGIYRDGAYAVICGYADRKCEFYMTSTNGIAVERE